jgi:penicillin-binding protein 2
VFFIQLKNYIHEKKQFKKRIIKASIVIIILTSLLILRLLNLQIFNHKRYVDLATMNQQVYLPLEPNRGLIYDRQGILLAENLPVFSLDIIKEQVRNIDETITQLKTIITIQEHDIERLKKSLLRNRSFAPVSLKMKLTPDEVAAFYINRYRFPGVIINTKMIRHYLLTHSIVNVLGYVGRINKQEKAIAPLDYLSSDFIGKVGIEKYYESTLRGKSGYKVAEVDAGGHIVRIMKVIPPTPGKTIYLTIDSKLQQVAQAALGEELGAVVVLNPNNGEVLALVSNPGYDPNLFTAGIDSATFKKLQLATSKPMYNRATKSIFPFGSTIKPFLALQSLDTEVITPNFTIMDNGWFKLENSNHPPYRDWKHGGHGLTNVTKAIIESSSIFFYTIAIKLGIEKIDNILERFGFGSKTNIDLGEESAGIVASPQWKLQHTGKRWYPGDTIISAIGQGDMKTTILQLAQGVATIAARGKRYQPHLLLATQFLNEEKIANPVVELPAVTIKDPNNWELIIKAMQGVVMNPAGTASRRFGTGFSYEVAGKTGTAQLYHHKVVNENPTPESDQHIPKKLRNHSLFIAFAPVQNPQIALAVVVENDNFAPQVARKILDYYFSSSH